MTLFREPPSLSEAGVEGQRARACARTWARTTVEDVRARRTRALLLDARASVDAAPQVAKLPATKMGRDDAWQHDQVTAYEELARGYIVG
jgi:glycerol-3-phosphate dehydrogenase